MKKYIQVFLLFVVVFTLDACVPVPIPVGTTTTTTYDQPYNYGYEDDYVDVPIVYGEPMYYVPPVAVTFAFDYFTYEASGGFVDIVFWKGGHRFHQKPWYDGGRRISQRDIRTSRPHYRVRGKEFYQHREKLERHHRISHPDAYYKLERYKQQQKIREEQEKQKRQKERYKHEQEMREQKEKQRRIEERNKYERDLEKQRDKRKEQEKRFKQEKEKRKQKDKLREQEERRKDEQKRREQKEKVKERERKIKEKERKKRDREKEEHNGRG